MTDELRRVREYDTARGVVPVAVGIENVADRHFEARRELRLQPAGEVTVDRIAHDDALGRHEEHRVVIVVLGAIQLPRHVDDAPLRRLWRSRRLLSRSAGDQDQ